MATNKSFMDKNLIAFSILIFVMILLVPTKKTVAATAQELDVSVEVALEHFRDGIVGGKEFLDNAQGVLVFPNIVKVGFGLGGEYGEGAMIVGGETVEYYSISSGSIGFQVGAQSKRLILVFMEQDTLNKFRDSLGWDFGVDGSAAFLNMGSGGTIDTTNLTTTIIGVVYDVKGLMVNGSLKSSKFTKIIK